MEYDFTRFEAQTQFYAQAAYQLAQFQKHAVIGEAHVFFALLEYPDALLKLVFENIPLDIDQIKKETYAVMQLQKKIPFWKKNKNPALVTPIVKRAIENTIAISIELGDDKVHSYHLLWGLVKATDQFREDRPQLANVFDAYNISEQTILMIIKFTGVSVKFAKNP